MGVDTVENIENGLLALLAAEQRARTHVNRKLSGVSELERTCQDLQARISRGQKARKEADQRLQDLRPGLERERRRRTEAEEHVRDKRQQLEDVNLRLEDATEKIYIARKYANQMRDLELNITKKRQELDQLRHDLTGQTETLNELRRKLMQQSRLYDEQTARDRSLAGMKKEVEAKLAGMESEKSTVRDTVKELTHELRTLDARIKQSANQRDKLRKECTEIEHKMHSESDAADSFTPVSYTHLRAHETPEHLVCRLLLEKKKKKQQ
eukprot:TRINITY_DN2631_c0_g1_i1.p1 TRINITY_DN2631_c0_g1~~TRINITY_DN2631_c0_g1_i1.p1  ORF type:complete len:268 (+),score=92.23 TRINITY_DN2631_c0_g1_i1:215-1018(+)